MSRIRRAEGRAAPGRGKPKLRVVPASPVRRTALPFYVVSLLLVGATVFTVVNLQALSSQASFRMQQLQSESATLQENYGRLKLQVAELSSPQRIMSEARRLGLTPPTEVETVTVGGPFPLADQGGGAGVPSDLRGLRPGEP